MAQLQYFLDLDGVFADFNRGVVEITGKQPYEMPTGRMWAAVHSRKDFFLSLNFMPGAEVLWDYFKDANPTFLTGAPSSQAFRDQKVEWVKLKFGPQYTTIVLPKKEKQLHSGPYKVLVDDSAQNIEQWVSKGGYGFLYEGDPHVTIAALEELRRGIVTG